MPFVTKDVTEREAKWTASKGGMERRAKVEHIE